MVSPLPKLLVQGKHFHTFPPNICRKSAILSKSRIFCRNIVKLYILFCAKKKTVLIMSPLTRHPPWHANVFTPSSFASSSWPWAASYSFPSSPLRTQLLNAPTTLAHTTPSHSRTHPPPKLIPPPTYPTGLTGTTHSLTSSATSPTYSSDHTGS